ncbi:hypothetical protein DFP72DRAFT_924402 [Ephemerocybe angulata]|uniref:Uncharacterized protein n=1 Tax=Ephemerocybe angulata TaxID=980116 RepID=A0A8H6HG76_9AGAR|nr:hypothetical protein DFP72DRAFT_924402 [Tulosesus angulatus]
MRNRPSFYRPSSSCRPANRSYHLLPSLPLLTYPVTHTTTATHPASSKYLPPNDEAHPRWRAPPLHNIRHALPASTRHRPHLLTTYPTTLAGWKARTARTIPSGESTPFVVVNPACEFNMPWLVPSVAYCIGSHDINKSLNGTAWVGKAQAHGYGGAAAAADMDVEGVVKARLISSFASRAGSSCATTPWPRAHAGDCCRHMLERPESIPSNVHRRRVRHQRRPSKTRAAMTVRTTVHNRHHEGVCKVYCLHLVGAGPP